MGIIGHLIDAAQAAQNGGGEDKERKRNKTRPTYDNTSDGSAERKNAENVTTEESEFQSSTPVGIEKAYDNSSFGTENPDYIGLAVATTVKPYNDMGIHIGSEQAVKPNHFEELDPTDKNYTVGTKACSTEYLCVPNVSVPTGTKELGSELTDESSVTYKTIEDVNKIADTLDDIPEAIQKINILSDEFKHLPLELQNQILKDKLNSLDGLRNNELNTYGDYPDLSAYKLADFPKLPEVNISENPELKDILSNINKLLEDSKADIAIPVKPASRDDLTTTNINGEGVFDKLATTIFHQLDNARKLNLITQNEVGNIYSQTLVQAMQTASQFVLESTNIFWQNQLVRAQVLQTQVQTMLAKAELLMLPTKVRLAYAELEAQLAQVEVAKVQTQIEREKYPQIIAQTDQILKQTDQLVLQSEGVKLQNNLQEVQIELTKEQVVQYHIQTELNKEQVLQANEQTKQIAAQTNKMLEETKLVDAQTQLGLKQVKLADIQAKTAKAQIKVMAQQLEREKENVGLVRAQVASTFANIATVKEQLKTYKAQYSDTINGKPIGGVLGAQINVNKAQALGFERNAFNNFFSQLQSGWATKKTADIATISPAGFNALGIDRALNWYSQKYFGMPNDIFQMPAGYVDYLTDAQMDAQEPTPSAGGKVKTEE